MYTRLLAALMLAGTLAACQQDAGGGGDDDDASTPVDGALADDGVDPDEGVEPDEGATADAGVETDDGVGPDGAIEADMAVEPDMAVERPPIEDCAGACARIAECDRLDLFGDLETCVDECGRASRRAAPEEWFACLEAEDNCGLIQLCRLPEPPPLTCDEVCALTDTCEVDLPFPDCAAECAARNGDDPDAPRFAACGEALDVGCGVDGFWQCLGDTVYTRCQRRCDVSIECNLERAEGCLQNCIAEEFVEDPLSRRRGEQRTQCIALIGRSGQPLSNEECQRADQCLNPQAGPVVIDRATFCRQWDQCAADFGFPCDEIWQIADEQPGFAECVFAQFQNGCPPDPFFAIEQCFDGGGGQVGPGCAELCEAQGLCGLLPDGQEQLDCLRDCGNNLNGSQEDADRQRAVFPCGIVETCDELDVCLQENSPASACETHCAALAGCGLGGDGCVAECDALFFRARQIAFRECVAEAGDDCAAMAECDAGQPIGCAERCERLGACGRFDPNCEQQCDDESFRDPASATRQLACVTSAILCSEGAASVFRCPGNPGVAGQDCLGFCRAATGCDPDDVDGLVACLVECGEGLVGDDGLRLTEARACLAGVDVNGACGPIEACIPAEPSVPCAGWCGPLDACEAAPGDCAAICPDDEVARLRANTQNACLAEAGEVCDDVAACIADQEEVEPPVDVGALCRDYAACGLEDFFPCEFLIEEFGAQQDQLRCVQAAIDPCPPDPFIIFELCFNGEPGGEVANLSACGEFCEIRARCGADGQGIRDCTANCVSSVRREPNGIQASLLTCRDALTCPELAACVVANGPAGRCEDVCNQAVACGAFPDVEACQIVCGDALLDPLTPRTYLDDVAACLGELGEGADACVDAGEGCFEIEFGPCQAACAAGLACGLELGGTPEECVAGCQQDQGPEGQQIIQCILDNLRPPDDCDVLGLQICVEEFERGEPEPPGEPEPVDPEPNPIPER